ncbi:MAG: CoA-binding protein, partial [Chromatiales bacterium]|nr:CoA-binding protein [Chromatiales bacterium]
PPADAAEACELLQFPLVVKGVSPALIHKSDAGAVMLNLEDVDAVRNACLTMPDSVGDLHGFLIEEMAPAGHEVIVGGIIDPQFGPVLMVGLGGIFVEVLADVACRICPINRGDAAAMLNELRAVAVLDGARGQTAASRDAIVDVLMRVGGSEGLLFRQQAEIAELDINPLIVSRDGAVAVDARIVLRATPLPATRQSTRTTEETRALFQPLFEPSSIAVVGASATRRTRSNTIIDQLLSYGFDREKLYPIHPSAAEIDGLPAYPSLCETPQPVDYAYIAIPAAGVAEFLSQAHGRLRIAHVTSSGFAEFGRQDLQDELVASAYDIGARVLGPNCNGGHSPRGKLTFCYDSAPDEGSVGIILQSGGLGVDVIRRGNHRGLRFSGVMTVGNCADIGVVDLLEFYLGDPATRVIGMYLEGAPDGRRVFEQLVARQPAKPVVILKGGRSERGREVTLSHTGTLAGDDRIWGALCQQTGAVLAVSLDDFIDKLLALQCVTPRAVNPTVRAMLLGNGGGTSVLGVDALGRVGIDVTPFLPDTVAQLHAMGLGAGAAYSNPVDLPQPVLVARQGRDAEAILRVIFEREEPQAVIVHVNLSVVMSLVRGDDDPLADLVEAAVRVKDDYPGKAHFLLVLRSDGSLAFETARIRYRAKALEHGIPTYDEIPAAANALAAIAHHEEFLSR